MKERADIEKGLLAFADLSHGDLGAASLCANHHCCKYTGGRVAHFHLGERTGMAETSSLPRTFVSFSSADIGRYHLMCAWKAHEHIDFNFADFQLDEEINSDRPSYIKTVCAQKIRRSDTFVLLIGNDTYKKTVFVKAEVETAVEKGCRMIGVNLNNCRFKDALCPAFFADVGALFVPFSPRILAEALAWNSPGTHLWYYFIDQVYTQLGYQLSGDTAVLPPSPNPFAGGNRPFRAK